MSDVVVGVSDVAVSTDGAETLVTYALGSCVSVVLFDRVAGVGAMSHSMLPVSTANPLKAQASPLTYTDLSVTELLRRVFDLGATRRELRAVLVGAASSLDDEGLYRIGERNRMVARRVLWRNDILVAAEECGGRDPRSVFLTMADGAVHVRVNGGLKRV